MFLKNTFLKVTLLLVSSALSAQDYTEQAKGKLASRLRSADEAETVNLESEISFNIEIPGVEFIPCQASIALGYYQRNTHARVESEIANNACSASAGTFDLQATIRTENGETSTLTFPESWHLDGATKTAFTRDYPIGENVELLRIRSSRVKCDCTKKEDE